ncbi:hypothetical protein F5887DRAFT_1236073 [Amanita rubescens]|nr:hypothetical protein F5887DRAFT_1236073 [Amanita rubescens]
MIEGFARRTWMSNENTFSKTAAQELDAFDRVAWQRPCSFNDIVKKIGRCHLFRSLYVFKRLFLAELKLKHIRSNRIFEIGGIPLREELAIEILRRQEAAKRMEFITLYSAPVLHPPKPPLEALVDSTVAPHAPTA